MQLAAELEANKHIEYFHRSDELFSYPFFGFLQSVAAEKKKDKSMPTGEVRGALLLAGPFRADPEQVGRATEGFELFR